jgi:hypothetical protein
MVRSQSLLETNDDTQDSQAVFEALQAELGCATGFDGGTSQGAPAPLMPRSTCVSVHGSAIANEITAQNASTSSTNQQVVLESSAVASRSVAADVYEVCTLG